MSSPMLGGNSISVPRVLPSMVIRPSVGWINPASNRSSMVFPEPLIPRKPVTRPASMDKVTPCRTVFPRMVFVTFSKMILMTSPLFPICLYV